MWSHAIKDISNLTMTPHDLSAYLTLPGARQHFCEYRSRDYNRTFLRRTLLHVACSTVTYVWEAASWVRGYWQSGSVPCRLKVLMVSARRFISFECLRESYVNWREFWLLWWIGYRNIWQTFQFFIPQVGLRRHIKISRARLTCWALL